MSAVEWSHDFETRSACDLRTAGMYRYFEDPSTDALCLAWRASPDQPGGLWKRGDAPPAELCRHIESGGVLRGWNAGFERQCFEKIMGQRYGWPVPTPEQFVCTMAEAGAMALPRRLENCAPVLGLEQRKDMDGSKAMKKLCKPRKTWMPDMPGYAKAHDAAILDDVRYTIMGSTIIEWWADKSLLDQLYPYCEQDVLVEMLISRKVRRLSDAERAVWLLDQRINDRGITVDLPLVRASMDMAATASKRLNNDMAAATGWQVTAATKAKSIIEWITAQGVEVDSVKKSAVRDLLARDDLPAAVREVAELRKEAAKSSTAKLKAFVKAAGSDGRVRGLLMYCGANTGRWAGRLVQPQNFPRGVVKKVEYALPLIESGDIDLLEDLFGPALDVISSALRSMMTASPGKKLFCADYSNIEGRVNAFLAGEEWKIKAFSAYDEGHGEDLYKLAYSQAFGVPISQVGDEERQRGKVMELSCGYQGSVGAFQAMAGNYGLKVSDEEAGRLAKAWREAHPAIVQSWRDLEGAAMRAVLQPGQVVPVLEGKVRYIVKGGYLWCILPSGRALCYASPKIEPQLMRWKDRNGGDVWRDSVAFWTWNSNGQKGPVGWVKSYGYGGHWCENITQAVARDIMCHGMMNVEAKNYSILLTVHDELVSERDDDGAGSVEEFESLMSDLPAWAAGCPVAASGYSAYRYKK